jgi:hypothetical protein
VRPQTEYRKNRRGNGKPYECAASRNFYAEPAFAYCICGGGFPGIVSISFGYRPLAKHGLLSPIGDFGQGKPEARRR